MDETVDPLDNPVAYYKSTAAEHEAARRRLIEAIVAARKAGRSQSDIATKVGFSREHVRRLERANGITGPQT